MLKRQRPSTPPQSFAEIPPSSDFAYGDPSRLEHGAKRRRVVAPVLDGRERGMQMDDKDWSDDEEEYMDPASHAAEGSTNWEEQAGQYKHSNVLLHQLHIEHQRRSQSSICVSLNCIDHTKSSVIPFPNHSAKHEQLGAPIRPPHEPPLPNPTASSSEDVNMFKESSSVRARYEDNNRQVTVHWK